MPSSAGKSIRNPPAAQEGRRRRSRKVISFPGMLTLLLGALLAAPPASARPGNGRLNIVVLDVCSARADRFGAFGGPRGLTPGLDAFAGEAAVFTNAWAQSSWCLPNYASLMTGHRAESHGLNSDAPFRPLSHKEETVAGRLRAAGYRTGAFSSGAHDLHSWELDRGFDVYRDRFQNGASVAGRFADEIPEIEKWVSADVTKPFFLYATVDDLHTPYQSDEPFDPASGPALDTATLSVEFFRAYNDPALPKDSPLAAKVAAFRRDPRSLGTVEARYRAALRATDRAVSRLLADLKAQGRWDDTLIIVTSDHGELLGEHGLLGHTEGLYEPILRVPLLIHDPRTPRSNGARVPALVERVDLAPTILAAAGADSSRMELQGQDLAPLITGRAPSVRALAYASSRRQLGGEGWDIDERAIRDERFKLLWAAARGRWELYDLVDDPAETRDISAARPDILARLSFGMVTALESARTHSRGRPSGARWAEMGAAPVAP